MEQLPALSEEETLDPEDWTSMRELGHKMLDDMFDYMQTIRERPVWRHAPDHLKTQFNRSVPLDPQPPEKIYQEFLEQILPYPVGNIHPRFWGWVLGPGTAFGSLAELLTATMNIGSTGGLAYNSANYVELQVLDWFKEMLGFPGSASGLLTSGCSAANLIGLTVARNAKAGYDLRREGMQAAGHKMVLYASQQIHSSIQKAVETLGLGSEALRLIGFNDRFQIDLQMLVETIAQDREDGYLPFCVVGAAGTTDTGAVDDLNALADICREENLWFHVDGAFGAWAALAPDASHIVSGMERADSLAFDLHKWMYMPYEIGCVLVRSEEEHRKTFSLMPVYLTHGDESRGLSGEDLPWLQDYGFQLSRGFRALKAWMSLKEHGALKYGRLIQQNIDQARYLADLVLAAPNLELVAPVTLNVVCFRYTGTNLDEANLDELNKQIVTELQERGVVVVSGSIVNGKYIMHVANVNHRTLRSDFDVLIEEVIQVAEDLTR
jgi:aromatic-L-amino-acid decarboxylase